MDTENEIHNAGIKFSSCEELDSYLRRSLRLNRTADPTNTKYLYGGILRRLELYRQIVLDRYDMTVTAYDRRFYTRIDLREEFPENAGLTFRKVLSKATLGEILDEDTAMRDLENTYSLP